MKSTNASGTADTSEWIRRAFVMGACLTFVASISACGGSGGPLTQSGGSINSTQLVTAQVGNQFSTLLSNLQPNVTPNVNLPTGVGFNEEEEGPYSTCVTKSPETPVDADADGIPVQQDFTYDCRDIAGDGGGMSSVIGSYAVRDLDDTKDWAQGGYSYNFDLASAYQFGTTHDFKTTYSGFWKAESTATTMGMESNFTSEVIGKEHGLSINFAYQSTHKSVYTPVDMANPYLAGALSIDGFFRLEGELSTGTTSVPALKVVFKMKSENLVYEYPGCTHYFKSGSLAFEDGSGNTLVYTFNCTAAPTVTFNGVAQFMRLN